MTHRRALRSLIAMTVLPAAALLAGAAWAKDITLLNVSYDPTREALARIQRSVLGVLAGQDRRQGQRQAVAWRLRQAGEPMLHRRGAENAEFSRRQPMSSLRSSAFSAPLR